MEGQTDLRSYVGDGRSTGKSTGGWDLVPRPTDGTGGPPDDDGKRCAGVLLVVCPVSLVA